MVVSITAELTISYKIVLLIRGREGKYIADLICTRYYKLTGVLPPTWKYESSTASTMVA